MKLKSVVGAGILVMASVLSMGASGGCGSSLKKAENAAGTIAASLHTVAVANHTNTLETVDERKQIAEYVKAAAAANDDFIGSLKAAEAAGGAADTGAIFTAFKKLSDEITELQANGVLKIQNPQAQITFKLTMDGIQAALTTISALYPTTMASNAPHPHRHFPLPMAAIVFTAEEIEELISLAVAAGSYLVPKLEALKGKTGAEILTDAAADDLAAEQIAAEDGA